MKKIIFTLIGRLASLAFFFAIMTFMYVCANQPGVNKVALGFAWFVMVICFAFVWWITLTIATANYKITK